MILPLRRDLIVAPLKKAFAGHAIAATQRRRDPAFIFALVILYCYSFGSLGHLQFQLVHRKEQTLDVYVWGCAYYNTIPYVRTEHLWRLGVLGFVYRIQNSQMTEVLTAIILPEWCLARTQGSLIVLREPNFDCFYFDINAMSP